MTHRERRGVLPLLALLLFLNSAVCYCLGFSHDHAHHGQDPEAPAPHDCECLTAVQPLPADQQVQASAAGFVALAVDPAPVRLSCAPLGSFSGEVRPPRDHSPPSYLLHCTLLC